MRRHLLVVSRDQAQLYGYLAQTFASDETVQVVLDRRFGDRRQRPDDRTPDRRRGDSRSRADIDGRLVVRGYALVCCD